MRAIACLAAFAAGASFAAAEASRAEIAARLAQQLADVPATNFPLGAAAFDEELRARVEAGSAAAAPVLEAGKKVWERKFRNGRSLAACFPNGGRRVAATYPQYDPRLKRVITLEMAVNQCLKTHKEPLLEHGDPQGMGSVTAYVRSLANGQKVAVRVPAAADERFEQGKRLYFTRRGQRNFACASCHLQGAGKRYLDTPLSPAIGQATHFPVIRGGVALTLHGRMRQCLELMGAAPFAAGSEELNDLEFFLTYLSNGLRVLPAPWRPG
ncbi:MAG: sulfur oxidation c-type cytochrome SoxA [Usitatibacter sp.]